MKLIDLIECNKSLSSLKDKHLPVSLGFAISRNFKKLVPIMEDYENKKMMLLRKYAKKDEEGQIYTNKLGQAMIPISAEVEFNKEMDELVSSEMEIVFDKVPNDTLTRCEEDARYDIPTSEELGFIDDYMLEK